MSEARHASLKDENKLKEEVSGVESIRKELGLSKDLLNLHSRQISSRIRKARRGNRDQRDWLLWSVEPFGADEHGDFEDWLRGLVRDVLHLVPEGGYKLALADIVEDPFRNGVRDQRGIYEHRGVGMHRIVAMPSIGLIGFFGASGELRKRLDPKGNSTAWNWSMVGVPSSEHLETKFATPEQLESHGRHVRKLREAFGTGKKSTLCVIDSGICPNSQELHDNVEQKWSMRLGNDGRIRPDYKQGDDTVGHGTQTASLAVGKTLGVACDARVISIRIDMQVRGTKLEYDFLDLTEAFEVLLSEHSQMVGETSIIDLIDTLLLPSGIFRSPHADLKDFQARIMTKLPSLLQEHNVVIVAAIGNQPGQTTFPADQPHVFSVGALTEDGNRWSKSGFGLDGTGARELPTAYICGCNLPCEDLGGRKLLKSGTSMAAAVVAGIFTAMAQTNRNSRSRWTRMQNFIKVSDEENGKLPCIVAHD